jgi:DNA helicase-2/ATP-dependent DNA helicase PcrA
MPLKLKKVVEESSESQILKFLNPQQKKAVAHIHGPLLIIAGAGSGKTRVLTHRIAFLLEQGVKPYNILALTFTNKAANEMKERIGKLVSSEATRQLWAGTFHSIFARILRTEAQYIGYTSSFSIYDTDDSLKVIRRIINDMGMSQQKFPPQGFRSRISQAKNKGLTWRDYAEQADNPIDKTTADVFMEYEKQLNQSNAMDFDDLLINMVILLKKNPDILQKYQNRFKYILVDEYQDTNRTQYDVLNLLAKSHKNIAVVGDDAQSIYRWRGAEIQNILDFQKYFVNTDVIRLEQNYRSTKTIIAAAGSMISRNQNQIPKKLWTENDQGEQIEIIQCQDDKEEASRIVKVIKKQKEEQKLFFSDFAVLYRINAQSQVLEYAFRRAKIPYMIIGGISFYKRKEVKDVMAYLRLLVNQSDDEALLRCINEPPRGIGETSIRHVVNYRNDHNISLYEAFLNADDNDALQNRAKNAIKGFTDLIDEYISKKEALSTKELVINFIEETGLPEMYKEIGTEDANDRWNNIQQIISDVASYLRSNPEASLEEYLQESSLMTDIDDKDMGSDNVKLMTMHSAKGLEFPFVFIAGMEEGLFPLARTEMHPEEEEEERRLFYVGMTRAEQKLYLTYAQRRMRFGETKQCSPSPFLSELDNKYINWDKGTSGIFRPPSKPNQGIKRQSTLFNDIPRNESYSQIPEAELELKSGDIVVHSHFGKGRILSLNGEGDKRQALIQFLNVGRKRLMLKYAKLERVK